MLHSVMAWLLVNRVMDTSYTVRKLKFFGVHWFVVFNPLNAFWADTIPLVSTPPLAALGITTATTADKGFYAFHIPFSDLPPQNLTRNLAAGMAGVVGVIIFYFLHHPIVSFYRPVLRLSWWNPRFEG